MKIKKQVSYILENEYGVQALAPTPGQTVQLEFGDGQYHFGEVAAVTGQGVTISRSDGDYTYAADEIQDIKMISY